MQEDQIPVTPVVTPQVVVETPKQSNFLVILLSILLIISVSIAGFFAYQTQKLVKELTVLRTAPTPVASIEPMATPDPTANWKTYSDSDFSLKYPIEWIISNGNYLNGYKYISLGTECLDFKVSKYSTTNTLEKFIQQNENTSENISEIKGPDSDQFTKTLNNNGIESFSLGKHGFGQIDNIYLKNKQTILYLKLSELSVEELPTDQQINNKCNFSKTSTFDQILSTFRFTN